jgi:phage gpG-like protein
MADTGDVKVVGFDELQRGTRELGSALEKRADTEMLEIAKRRAETVRLIVPRVTGRLAGSVTADTSEGRAIVGMGDEQVLYAGWIEFGGTRGRPYIPDGRYLTPTATGNERQVLDDLSKAAEDEIKGFRWPTVMGA